jgi:hypothetical protein
MKDGSGWRMYIMKTAFQCIRRSWSSGTIATEVQRMGRYLWHNRRGSAFLTACSFTKAQRHKTKLQARICTILVLRIKQSSSYIYMSSSYSISHQTNHAFPKFIVRAIVGSLLSSLPAFCCTLCLPLLIISSRNLF